MSFTRTNSSQSKTFVFSFPPPPPSKIRFGMLSELVKNSLCYLLQVDLDSKTKEIVKHKRQIFGVRERKKKECLMLICKCLAAKIISFNSSRVKYVKTTTTKRLNRLRKVFLLRTTETNFCSPKSDIEEFKSQ